MTSSETSVSIRVVGSDDWRLWRTLRLEALREAPAAFGSKLADWQGAGDTETRWRTRLTAVPHNTVCYLDGAAVGMVSATAPEDGNIELISMWVAPHARGRGVGDALVQAIIAWARDQGATRLSLAVVESNARAIALYRRNDFVDCGTIDAVDSDHPTERRMSLDLRLD